MGAVEHVKILCCLGLKPESAIIAVTAKIRKEPHAEFPRSRLNPTVSFLFVFTG
jgi:hypothetical protein